MKKFLKKLLICFFILVIFGAAIFFIGWSQLRIKPDCIGVLKSKTGGVLSEAIYPGKFSWRWEFLLPTNAKLTSFELKSYEINKSVQGKLPSGEVYAEILKTNVDFSYNFDFDFSVSVQADKITKLFSELVISDQQSLEKYIEKQCDTAAKLLASEIIKKLEANPLYNPDILTYEDLKTFIDFDKKFQNIQFNEIILKNCKYPDFALYNSARSAYLLQLGKGI